ncbi:hypothetical protein NUW58_g6177 [Xylaria curta]|uniref:Uncharacterized protein n=1 Tax=Xylaria curta TaxID=42375 RepID=A0ACC1NYA5_9PEZI|nr:hypothetical protein NUW58_g6177 [Xylaria curta]
MLPTIIDHHQRALNEERKRAQENTDNKRQLKEAQNNEKKVQDNKKEAHDNEEKSQDNEEKVQNNEEKAQDNQEKAQDNANEEQSEMQANVDPVKKFNEEYHSGREPPHITALPETFECIHCHNVIYLKYRVTNEDGLQGHQGGLRLSSRMFVKSRRWSAGDYDIEEDEDDEGRVWSCCDRRKHESPRKDWWNVRFSRGDPRLRKEVRARTFDKDGLNRGNAVHVERA